MWLMSWIYTNFIPTHMMEKEKSIIKKKMESSIKIEKFD